MPAMLSAQLPAESSAAGPADVPRPHGSLPRLTRLSAGLTPPAASTNLRAAAQSSLPGEVLLNKPSPERSITGNAFGLPDSAPDAATRSSPSSEFRLTCGGESATAEDPAAPRSAPTIAETGFPSAAGECVRSEEHTSELQSLRHLVCRL